MPTIRSAYGPRLRESIAFVDEDGVPFPTRTKQSFKEECDITNILTKFQRTGIIEHARRHGGVYGNFPDVDFKTAMDIVAKGRSMWEDLPSSLKKRFGGPEAFLEFVQDDENWQEAYDLGLTENRPPADAEAPGGADRPEGDVEPPAGGGTED